MTTQLRQTVQSPATRSEVGPDTTLPAPGRERMAAALEITFSGKPVQAKHPRKKKAAMRHRTVVLKGPNLNSRGCQPTESWPNTYDPDGVATVLPGPVGFTHGYSYRAASRLRRAWCGCQIAPARSFWDTAQAARWAPVHRHGANLPGAGSGRDARNPRRRLTDRPGDRTSSAASDPP